MSEQRILELEALVEQLEEDLCQDVSISNELFEENQELKVKVRGLELIAQELVEALKKAHEYIGDINSFYGQGLQVYGWHLNGTLEPLDNFIDSNGGCEAEEFVGRVLTKAKEVLGDGNGGD